MADNLLQAAMTAAWKTDPAFVVLAKSLYGEDAEYQDIVEAVFKADPDPSAVHVPGGGKKKPKVMDNRALIETKEELGKVLATSVAKGLITNEVALEVAKDWAEYDSKRQANAAMYRDAQKHPSKYNKDPEIKHHLHRALGGLAGYELGTGGAILGVVSGLDQHHNAMHHAGATQRHMRQAQHHANLARDAAEMHHGEEAIRRHMEAGKQAYDAGQASNKAAAKAAKTSLTHGRLGVASAGVAAGSLAYMVHENKKMNERRREIAQVRVKTAKRMTTGQAAALGGVTGAGVGLTIAGPKAGAVAGGAAAGAAAAAQHYHRKYLKEHIKNSHSGHYDKCQTCAQRRASSVIKILRGPVIKEWADFDAKRAGRAGLVAGVGTGAVLQHQSQKVKTNVLADVVEGKTSTAKGSARGLEDLAHAASLSRRGGKAALLGVTAAVAGEAVAHHKKVEKAHEVTWEGEFSKVDDDKRQVFGWASVTEIDGKPVVDLQGDYIHPTEMERAAYEYVLKSRKGGDMHRRVDENGQLIEKADAPLHVSDMIESMVFTPEKVAKLGLPEGSLPTGWWVGFKVNDEPTWNLVKSGERKGFSIHGLGARMEKRLEEIDPQSALVGKAFEESDSYEEFQANLETISEVTGDEVYKHLAHGINNPEGHNQYTAGVNMQPDGTTTRNEIVGAGLGLGVGSHVGALAGMATGKHEGRNVGMAVGAIAGAATGAYLGHRAGSKPQRPPAVEAALGPKLEKTSKAVSTANRSGSMGHRQNYYQQQALQEATAQLAPQVAQHIQMMQQQKWQQAQIEQMQLQQQAGGQKPQDWRTTQQQPQMPTPMGPYGMNDQDTTNGGVTPGQQTGPMAPIS